MSTEILSVNKLSKRFTPDAPLVVRDVSFDVRDNEIFAVLGPSGCGKTTMLRCIAGFERASSGTVCMRDRMLEGPGVHVPPEERGVGLVFQDYALFPHLTVLENVVFGLKNVPKAERETQAREALKMVGLNGFENRTPHHLSGGQQQRVALARTLAPCPELILLDEPFSNLDALLREGTRQEVRGLLKERGMSAVLVTHDQEEALSFADRVAVMRGGQIEQVGTPEEVYYQPRTLFVAQFLGRTNLLLSQARGRQAQTALGEIGLNRDAEGTVLVSLRPEHLTLEPGDTDAGPTGTVIDRAFKGHDITYRVECDGAEYLVHTHNRMSYQPGDHVSIRPQESAVVLESRSTPMDTTNGVTSEETVAQK
ncbi:iron ABC transporter ATP-binding protein [Longibacter salinarum]|uniref:Iron ABC transporter ATP-binding protein n=1 Tax=Longibacter salinarum TaxID=1850348 RepID=A0A2A8CZQ9_9BACT|nr:ABC transporter ATP-binding protein [Longibacter salinarum]PEN14182.1 iron ABC transporter ATP-binding protein [Longibacter salinarum]